MTLSSPCLSFDFRCLWALIPFETNCSQTWQTFATLHLNVPTHAQNHACLEVPCHNKSSLSPGAIFSTSFGSLCFSAACQLICQICLVRREGGLVSCPATLIASSPWNSSNIFASSYRFSTAVDGTNLRVDQMVFFFMVKQARTKAISGTSSTVQQPRIMTLKSTKATVST